MVLADEKSRPVSVIIASASVHEVRLAEEVIRQRASKARPRRITADRAYDSDALDKKLKRKGIELNAPHRKGRRKPPTQDGRKLRAYTAEGGKWSGSLPGYSTSDAVPPDTSTTQKTTKRSCSSLLPSS
jgi:hypothetical protein